MTESHTRPEESGESPWTDEPFETVERVAALDGQLREALGVPSDRPAEPLDVRRLGPPKPLTETMQRLEATDEEVVLLQRNDRVPTHLFGRLDDRGYRYGAAEREGEALTAVWTD